MMSQNVLIPLSLLDQIIELLGYWDISEYGPPLSDDYENILWALNVKKRKLELRDAYAKIIQAKNPNIQEEARIHYLQLREILKADEEPPF